MSNREIIEWLKKKAEAVPMPGARKMYEAAAKALEAAQPEHGTNLAEVGRDCISRQAAIDEIGEWIKAFLESAHKQSAADARLIQDGIIQLPSAQPEIIQCRNCKFASGDSRICMKFGHSPIGELDFCAWAERRTDE